MEGSRGFTLLMFGTRIIMMSSKRSELDSEPHLTGGEIEQSVGVSNQLVPVAIHQVTHGDGEHKYGMQWVQAPMTHGLD